MAMSNTKREYEVHQFDCSLVGRRVRIDRDYLVHVSRDDEERTRVLVGTDCSDKNDCPVAKKNGMSTSYDWDKCVYMQAIKSRP